MRICVIAYNGYESDMEIQLNTVAYFMLNPYSTYPSIFDYSVFTKADGDFEL